MKHNVVDLKTASPRMRSVPCPWAHLFSDDTHILRVNTLLGSTDHYNQWTGLMIALELGSIVYVCQSRIAWIASDHENESLRQLAADWISLYGDRSPSAAD